jgi:PBSX family phage terminase large subunit
MTNAQLPDYLVNAAREHRYQKAKAAGQKPQFDMQGMPSQSRFVDTQAHYSAFVGGIGSGKTYTGCIRALLASQGQIGTTHNAIQTPNLGAITAPTYPMLRDVTIRTFLEVAGKAVVSYRSSEHIALLTNGSEVIFRSAENPERLRGANLAWWFGDEAAFYTPDVWRIMIGRLRQFGKHGYAWIGTTPKGRNWVYQEFVQKERPDYTIFKAKTKDNIHLAPEFIESLEASYVGDFAAQELDGEFVAFEGLIYPEFNRDLHVTNTHPNEFKRVTAGVDWGYANPGVIAVVGEDYDGRAYLVHEEYVRQRGIDDWARVAAQLKNTWGIRTFFCDPSEPDYIKKLRGAGCNAVQANNTVTTGIQVVKARLVKRGDNKARFVLKPSCVNAIAEFEQYQWAENKLGIKDEPVKANDHIMDAIRYDLMGIDFNINQLEVKTKSYIGN